MKKFLDKVNLDILISKVEKYIHKFCRYADHNSIDVKSKEAVELRIYNKVRFYVNRNIEISMEYRLLNLYKLLR